MLWTWKHNCERKSLTCKGNSKHQNKIPKYSIFKENPQPQNKILIWKENCKLGKQTLNLEKNSQLEKISEMENKTPNLKIKFWLNKKFWPWWENSKL